MPNVIKVRFREVLPGEFFTSKQGKRCFRGIKTLKIPFKSDTDVVLECDAVIIDDCSGRPAEDAGTFILMSGEEIVEVDRPLIKTESNKRTFDWYYDNCAEIENLADGSVKFHFDDGSSDTVIAEEYKKMKDDPNYSVE